MLRCSKFPNFLLLVFPSKPWPSIHNNLIFAIFSQVKTVAHNNITLNFCSWQYEKWRGVQRVSPILISIQGNDHEFYLVPRCTKSIFELHFPPFLLSLCREPHSNKALDFALELKRKLVSFSSYTITWLKIAQRRTIKDHYLIFLLEKIQNIKLSLQKLESISLYNLLSLSRFWTNEVKCEK